MGNHLVSATLRIQPSEGPEEPVLRLTTYDVRRGEAREVPLRFIDIRGQPHILYPARTPPEWVTTVTGSSFVRWSVGRQNFIGTAAAVSDQGDLVREVTLRYRAKFGADRFSRWFGSEVGCVILVSSGDVSYYKAVEALFDRSAPVYDGIVHGNRFDMHLRAVGLADLRRLFHAGQTVLELGCGTGLETLPLAAEGINVVALDLSSGMLERLRQKTTAGGFAGRIDARKLSIGDLSRLVEEFGEGSFDGAFSHFGALNCEPRLDLVPRILHRLVRPGGAISLGIWNRTCVAEMVLYGIALRPTRALARFRFSVPVGRSRFGVPVFPYSPGEMKRLFSGYFRLERALGVSILMPPYDLGRRLSSHPNLIPLLEAGDRILRDHRFVRYLGDHFLLEFRHWGGEGVG